jgi:hypothetical protein
MKQSAKIRQIEGWCKRYDIGFTKTTAQTGSVYYELTCSMVWSEANDDECACVTVRVADHQDAYGRTDYTVDPETDQSGSLKQWIIEHGDDTQAKSKTAMQRKFTEMKKRVGEYALLKDGSKWHSWGDTFRADYYERMLKQLETGSVE